MPRSVRFCLALSSLVGTARPAAAQGSSERPALTTASIALFADSAFAEYLRGSPQPSLAFVVVKDDAIVFARGYGTEDADKRRPVDPEATLFWLASLSKLITADAVMREVERGRLDLRSPAAKYLGWPLPRRKGWRPVTVEGLLTHTAGLDEPFMQGTESDPARLVPLGDYLARLRWRAGTRPGAVLRYSNHGMALAGHIVERSSTVPFAEYVEREIFAPLGMQHSTFHQPVPAALAQRIATAGTDQAVEFLLPSPAGAMVGTAGDMGRFLLAQLDTTGPRIQALRTMQATHWRAHPAVPGVALGWFETNLGGVPGLYHTGARHHFSVAWLAPTQRVGLVLVHSMRQGGPFQNLRTEVVRAFVERYFSSPRPPERAPAGGPLEGVYRPALLATTTVERAGYLFLDTRVRSAADGRITMHAPGGLGTITAVPIGQDVFEVRSGPQAGLRLGFIRHAAGSPRIAAGGTLMDPLVFTGLEWWQRGLVHAVVLVTACLALVFAAVARGIGWLVGRARGTVPARSSAWSVASAAGAALALAPVIIAGLIISTPELGAADHMRSGLRIALADLTLAAVLCALLPVAALHDWRRGSGNLRSRTTVSLLSLAGIVVVVFLLHYRLVGFQL